MKIQSLYCAEMKVIVDSVELMKGKTGGSEVETEKQSREKEQKGNKDKQTGV